MESSVAALVLPDKEEKDQLILSHKKVKVSETDKDNDTVMENGPRDLEEMPPKDTDQRRKSSFKEAALRGNKHGTTAPTSAPTAKDSYVSDDDANDGEDDKECPTVRLTAQEKRSLRRDWSQTS